MLAPQQTLASSKPTFSTCLPTLRSALGGRVRSASTASAMQQKEQPPWFRAALLVEQLSILLSACEEDVGRAAASRELFIERVVRSGALGPNPPMDGPGGLPTARWKSYMTDDHSPVEYSISISKNAGAKVRFSFEPAPPTEALQRADPVNALAPLAWVEEHQAYSPNMDLGWFHQLRKHLVLDPGPNVPDEAKGLTQLAFGCDLVGREPLLKAYMCTDALKRAHNRRRRQPVEAAYADAMRSIGLDQGWNAIDAYLRGLNAGRRPDEPAGTVEFLGVDCLSPELARVKVYVRFRVSGLDDLVSHLSLGGAVPSTDAALQSQISAAQDLWAAFCEVPVDVPAPATQATTTTATTGSSSVLACQDLDGQSERTKGIVAYYELRKGRPLPSAKFYLPVRHYFRSDALLADRMDDFLVRHGLVRERGWYSDLVRRLGAHRDLNSRSGLQTMIGCAIKNGERDVTIYLSPEVYARERGRA